MSAAAINPAPSPAAGAASAASATGHAQGAQATDPLGAFEAILSELFGAEGLGSAATGAAAGTAAGPKPTANGKTAADNGKAKAKVSADGEDDKTAAIDPGAAAATVDGNLALLVPAAPTLPVAATPSASDEGLAANASAQSAVAPGSDKAAASTAAAVLAQLANAGADDTAKADASAANANGAAISAAATAKAEGAPAIKTEAPIPAPQATTPPTPAAVAAPPAEPPGLAVATAAVAATPAAEVANPGGGKESVSKDVGGKDKALAPKNGPRVDLAKPDGAPGATISLAAKAADGLRLGSEGAPKGDAADEAPARPAQEAAAQADTAPASSESATAPGATAATLIHAAAVAVRAAPQTVANLAAQIVKKLDGRATQFDIQLDPAGLGKVDVRVAIGADGRMSAAMSFDTPQAAAELRSRASELQRALEQSGFDLSGGMSFDVASDRGQGGQAQNQQADTGAAFRGRAFQAALDTTADVAPPQLIHRRTALAGVDIRI